MKKLILFVLCALSGLMVSAQSRWGITPEGGFAAVNRVGMGSSWRAVERFATLDTMMAGVTQPTIMATTC